MDWHETRPGRFERSVDEPELFYTVLARMYESTGRALFAITGYVELSVVIPEGKTEEEIESKVDFALREAWRRLRYDHPTIGASVEYDSTTKRCTKVYETFIDDEEGQKESAWLEMSFKQIDTGVSGLEFCNEDPPINKYPTLYLITPPQVSENKRGVRRDVVLRSHHDIIDGIGTLMLLNNLFNHAAKVYTDDSYTARPFGDEYKNLSPSFRFAAGVPSTPSQAHKDRFKEISSKNATNVENAEVMTVPVTSNTALPGKNQRAAITLTELETKTLLEKSKMLGVSVTHAFHAGIVLAIRDLQEKLSEERTCKYVNYCLVNLREKCAAPYNSSRHAASVYHSASGKSLIIEIVVPSESAPPEPLEHLRSEFSRVVYQIKRFYVAVRSDPEHVAMVPLYYSTKPSDYSEQVQDVPAPSKTPTISISSMGVIDQLIQPENGPFELHDPWVTGDELSPGIGMFLGTWKGRLSLSAGYNEAYHAELDIIGILENVRDLVFKALDI